MGLFRLSFVFCIFFIFSVLGFEVDPALRINVFNELKLGVSFAGVSQVHGFHNESRAFLFQDVGRSVKAPADAAGRMLGKLRHRTEFTLLATLKQEQLNSGVILSIHHADQRFLELESSGQRDEIRLHYRARDGRPRSEVFPYALADGRWHKLSVAVSASHVLLHVDCNRIYERVVETPLLDIPAGASFWLGQRNGARGFFKGTMQDVQLLIMPQGYISQCPNLNRTCPTCNDFHGLVQKIMELQDLLAKTSSKLSRAEEKMNGLDSCHCERTCSAKGRVYREDQAWTDGCRNCTCANGTVLCEAMVCPPPQCPPGSAPAYVRGACCKECQSVCPFGGRAFAEGEAEAARDSSGKCQLLRCRNGTMHPVEDSPCPELNCPESEQIALPDRCCKVCRGHDFCAEGNACVEHSDCVSREAGASCSCKDGFRPLRDDSAYCQDVDECAEGKHYCRENTVCVNTPGSFLCVCRGGYIRIDDYSCTERDECATGQHSCDRNALCFNTVGGHSCSCKPGYSGNGTRCKASCEGACHNGGTCVSPDTCVCQQGFTGDRCENDIDECAAGFVECDSRATCVNLPGWYHCECRDGYHDNGLFSPNGESCEDIDECGTGRNSCANDTVCFNLDGGYDCRCPHGRNCTGDCVHDNKVKHHGQIWVLENDRCSVCSCQSGLVMCRRMVCDCENPTLDQFCCPECDTRLSSQCLHQNGLRAYASGDTWVENCQQCQCLRGEVDCWPLSCPPADCDFTAVPEGGCCPRCVADPCQADAARDDVARTCVDGRGVVRPGGSSWVERGTRCTLCRCKNGHACCSVDPMCL
ncbi:protein kinase C-binding protein NELL2-like isoform X3 [Anguilla rostrata]|uniref:protein kinase C-binding protein NELL2-like isoform X3 n=1 Tax=Anguilla rostrata TaxID=7938 RepID=UPI0030D1E6BD